MATKEEYKTMSKKTRKLLKRMAKYVTKQWGPRCTCAKYRICASAQAHMYCGLCMVWNAYDQFEGMVEDDV